MVQGISSREKRYVKVVSTTDEDGQVTPVSVEWEDGRMDRFHGAKESCEFVRKVDFAPSTLAFDGAFEQ